MELRWLGPGDEQGSRRSNLAPDVVYAAGQGA